MIPKWLKKLFGVKFSQRYLWVDLSMLCNRRPKFTYAFLCYCVFWTNSWHAKNKNNLWNLEIYPIMQEYSSTTWWKIICGYLRKSSGSSSWTNYNSEGKIRLIVHFYFIFIARILFHAEIQQYFVQYTMWHMASNSIWGYLWYTSQIRWKSFRNEIMSFYVTARIYKSDSLRLVREKKKLWNLKVDQ